MLSRRLAVNVQESRMVKIPCKFHWSNCNLTRGRTNAILSGVSFEKGWKLLIHTVRFKLMDLERMSMSVTTVDECTDSRLGIWERSQCWEYPKI